MRLLEIRIPFIGKVMNRNNTLNTILSKIRNTKRSVVISHQNPDGDTLGSMLALGAILREAGHVVDHVVSDSVPEVYRFLPFSDLIKLPTDKRLKENYDLAFSLDCGSLKRLGGSKALWLSASTTINIDHHISNEKFGQINWIKPNAISTGQLVHWLAKSLNIEISKEVATLLYTTLLTDTGCFSNSNTNEDALSWGAELISLGADHLGIYKGVYLQKPYKAIKVFGNALSNLNIIENGEIGWACVTRDIMEEQGATGEHTEEIVEYIMRTKGVKVGVFFREDNDETKVSLRSNVDLDVSEIAKSFGGGGHVRAAGMNIKAPFSQIKELVLNKVVDELKNFNGRQ